jgi:hypothetical protein
VAAIVVDFFNPAKLGYQMARSRHGTPSIFSLKNEPEEQE